MKKFFALSLACVLGLTSMTACGSSASESTSTSEAASSADSSSSESSSEGGTIRFGTNAEFPPFESVVTDGVLGEYDGIDMAIAAEIGDQLGMDVEMNNMEFDSLLVSLQNNQIDAVIAGMTVTEERAKAVSFSTPYYTATQVIIVKEDSDITKASDLADKTTAVVQGYTGETCMSDLAAENGGYSYEAFKKGTECILELVNGKCDAVVIDSATAEKYIGDNEGLKIVEDEDTFGSEEYAIAVAKDNTELLDKINTVIDKMIADGTISEISAQYIDADEE